MVTKLPHIRYQSISCLLGIFPVAWEFILKCLIFETCPSHEKNNRYKNRNDTPEWTENQRKSKRLNQWSHIGWMSHDTIESRITHSMSAIWLDANCAGEKPILLLCEEEEKLPQSRENSTESNQTPVEFWRPMISPTIESCHDIHHDSGEKWRKENLLVPRFRILPWLRSLRKQVIIDLQDSISNYRHRETNSDIENPLCVVETTRGDKEEWEKYSSTDKVFHDVTSSHMYVWLRNNG